MKTQGKQISKRQLVCLLLFSCLASKVLAMPVYMSNEAGTGMWAAFLGSFAVYFVMFFLLMLVYRRHPSRTIDQILEGAVGKVGAKIFLAVLFLLFVLQTLGQSREIHRMIGVNFYSNIQFGVYALPVMLLLGFSAWKGLRALGRTSELFLLLFLAVLVLVFVLVLPSARVDRLLPIADLGPAVIPQAALTASFWFGDFFFILMVFGKIQPTRGVFRDALLTYAGAGIAVLMIMVLFLAIFGVMAPYEQFGQTLSGLMRFSVSDAVGKLGGIMNVLWLGGMLIRMMILFWAGNECLKRIFRPKNTLFTIVPCLIAFFFLNRYIFPVLEYLNAFYHFQINLASVSVHALLVLVCFFASLLCAKKEGLDNSAMTKADRAAAKHRKKEEQAHERQDKVPHTV